MLPLSDLGSSDFSRMMRSLLLPLLIISVSAFSPPHLRPPANAANTMNGCAWICSDCRNCTKAGSFGFLLFVDQSYGRCHIKLPSNYSYCRMPLLPGLLAQGMALPSSIVWTCGNNMPTPQCHCPQGQDKCILA